MLGHKPGWYWYICWKFLAPLFLLVSHRRRRSFSFSTFISFCYLLLLSPAICYSVFSNGVLRIVFKLFTLEIRFDGNVETRATQRVQRSKRAKKSMSKRGIATGIVYSKLVSVYLIASTFSSATIIVTHLVQGKSLRQHRLYILKLYFYNSILILFNLNILLLLTSSVIMTLYLT